MAFYSCWKFNISWCEQHEGGCSDSAFLEVKGYGVETVVHMLQRNLTSSIQLYAQQMTIAISNRMKPGKCRLSCWGFAGAWGETLPLSLRVCLSAGPGKLVKHLATFPNHDRHKYRHDSRDPFDLQVTI